jgi:hypothetical protein
MVATIDYDSNPEFYPVSPVADKVGRKRQRTLVCFDDNVKQQPTYSRDDVKDCWYSHEDYQAIKENVLETVELMRQNVPIDDITYCRRGLEWFEKENTEKYEALEKQKRPVRVVMDIQAMGQASLQDSATLADSIAQHYAQESQYCKMTAYLTGIADERSAKAISSEVKPTGVQATLPRTSHNNSKSAPSPRLGLPPLSPSRRVTPTFAHAA